MQKYLKSVQVLKLNKVMEHKGMIIYDKERKTSMQTNGKRWIGLC